MRAKRYLAGALAGVTLTVAGGCAARQMQALEPKLELRNAAQQLAEAPQGGFTVRLTGSPDDLIAAAEVSAGDRALVRKVFDSSVTVAYDRAHGRSSLAATVAGVGGTEIRYVDGVVYAKAPVTELAGALGASRAEITDLQADLGLPGVEAFFDGEWVSFEAAQTAELAASGLLGLPAGPQDQQRAVAELTTSAANLLDGAEVVRDEADSRHLIVTSSTAKGHAEAKRFATAVDETLGDDLGAAPPDRPVVLDLWLDGGRLSAAEINLLQFADGAEGRVAVRIEVTAGEPIAAPDGAIAIDTGGLLDGALLDDGLLGPDSIGVPGP